MDYKRKVNIILELQHNLLNFTYTKTYYYEKSKKSS